MVLRLSVFALRMIVRTGFSLKKLFMTLSNSQVDLMGVFFSCPMGKSMYNCPFREIHKMKPEHKLSILCSLKPEDIQHLLNYHDTCAFYRIGDEYEKVKNLKLSIFRDPDPDS